MRLIKYLLLGFVGILLLVLATANRGPVTLKLLPDEIAVFAKLNAQITLPLFLVIIGGMVAGVVLGFVWEWLREHKHRAVASKKTREVSQLEREIGKLKQTAPEGKDDVLTLLEDASPAR